jgi:hypothetical protein
MWKLHYFCQQETINSVRCKVLTKGTNRITFFYVKSPCGLVGRSQRFGEACCLRLQGGTMNEMSEINYTKIHLSKMYVINKSHYHQNASKNPCNFNSKGQYNGTDFFLRSQSHAQQETKSRYSVSKSPLPFHILSQMNSIYTLQT